MKTLVIYDSNFGNTQQIATEIAHMLEEFGEVILTQAEQADPTTLDEADLLVIGGPTQAHGTSPAIHHLLDNTPVIDHKIIWALAFDTRYDKPKWLTGSAALGIAHSLEKIGCRMLAQPESFFIEHKEGPLMEGESERSTTWARNALADIATPVGVR